MRITIKKVKDIKECYRLRVGGKDVAEVAHNRPPGSTIGIFGWYFYTVDDRLPSFNSLTDGYRRKSTWFTLKDATDACKEFIKENWLKKEYRDTP